MKRIEERIVLKKTVKRMLSRFLLTLILLLIGMISIKQNPETKIVLKENIYEKSFPFTKMKSVYQKYFGSVFSFSKKEKIKPVSNEMVSFHKIESYENGIQVEVAEEAGIPILESGVVIYIGEKERLGLTIIVEQVDGTKTFYGNIENHSVKLYDYVEKGNTLGKAKGNVLYLAFQKDGKYLNYEEYL